MRWLASRSSPKYNSVEVARPFGQSQGWHPRRGQKYIYEVRDVRFVWPDDKQVFRHDEYSWLTLITCKDYNKSTNSYAQRVVVSAVLISVEAEVNDVKNWYSNKLKLDGNSGDKSNSLPYSFRLFEY